MAHLRLSFLGSFQTALGSTLLEGYESDKVRALLAYLAVEAARSHRRDTLAGMFWPEQKQEIALKNLRQSLYRLRNALGEPSADSEIAPYLLVTPQTVQFNPAADCSLDTAQFSALIAECRAHRHRRIEVCGSCHARLKQAIDLYRGDFLEGFGLLDSAGFEEWMLLEREAFHRQALDALVRLAGFAEARADYDAAAAYAWRQIELEPWREEAHRQLMRLLWRSGQRSAAVAQYESCRRVLREQLNIGPAAETEALHALILDGESGQSAGAAIPGHTRYTLPSPTTPFVGRASELSRIAEQLESADRRLITLAGPGGSGKTRLALAAAHSHVGAFQDGVYFVPLAPLNSPHLIAGAISETISLPFAGSEDARVQLLRYLADKEMLVVLDNFEHLLAGADLVSEIMRSAPGVSLIVTSRERLSFQSEWVLDVTGLPFPDEAESSNLDGSRPESSGSSVNTELGTLNLEYGAIALFTERARASWSDFDLTPSVMRFVARICRLVAGLPLAIELAAARVRDYSCEEIAAEIKSNLDFLSATMRDVAPAHASIRAVFEYSWRLLSEQEQEAFQRLSVFRGGWDAPAAKAVANATPTVLGALADKSLLRRASGAQGVRYHIQEVLRQYAAERLAQDAKEQEAARLAHARHYLGLAEAAEPNLRGSEQATWLQRLEVEHANMQAAIRWTLEKGEYDLGLRLGGALWQFWLMHAHYATGRELLEAVAGRQEAVEGTPAGAKALLGAGRLALQQGDPTVAQGLMEKSLDIYRRLGDEAAVRALLIERGNVYRRLGSYLNGKPYWDEALRMARQAGDKGVMTSALTNLGSTALNQGDFAETRRLYEECLDLQREMDDKWGVAWTLTNLGTLAQYEGDSAKAADFYEDSLRIRREIGDRWGIAACLNHLGTVARDMGDYPLARSRISEALALRREIADRWAIAESLLGYGLLEFSERRFSDAGGRWGEAVQLAYQFESRHLLAFCLIGVSAVAAHTGNPEKAVMLGGYVSALLDSLGVTVSPTYRALYDETLAEARTRMSAEQWDRAREAGRTMSIDQAVECASELRC